jgi:CDP-paratose 2-epimerase
MNSPAEMIGCQDDARPVMITGGAGFVGVNLAARLAGQGKQVLIFDNFSRAGVEKNLAWLRNRFGDRIVVERADIRDRQAVERSVRRSGRIFHLAAQVAVTSSVADPRQDFEINAGGTLNILEAVRQCPSPPPLVFTSTNKVYGHIEGTTFTEHPSAYIPDDPDLQIRGISEKQHLDLYSPYGCSKGAADQYVMDYARIFGLKTVVLRMSCIYGPHQFGTEDQGWVAHFIIRALQNEPIIIYGNGKQVRDLLYVDDLVDALLLCQAGMNELRGRAFNIGGGPSRAISLLDFLALIEKLHGRQVEFAFSSWRPGDQVYYVADTASFGEATGWQPRVDIPSGSENLYRWLKLNTALPAIADVAAL